MSSRARRRSSFGHGGAHTLHQLGIPINAARLQEILDFGGELMNCRVLRGEPCQSQAEFERHIEICRALPARIGKYKLKVGPGPWRVDQLGDFFKKSWRQSGSLVDISCPLRKKHLEYACLLGSHAHPLTINGIEAANYVANRKEPAREDREALEVAQEIISEAVAHDLA